jgi:protease-4
MKFLRNLIASILGTLLALLIIFVLLISIASLVGDSEKVIVKNNSVLELKLDKKVKDYAPKSDDPLEEILGLNSDKISLNNIINAIENAKTDENIKGISIATLNINAGFAQTQVIRNKLEDFKESGKFIYAYADIYDQKSYYLSSVADSVFINPVGAVDFKGLSGEILYYKDLQDKTGVKMEVIRHGKYKSAVEPFLANEMSNENREQISSLLISVWDVLLNEMANSRSISVEKLNNIADNALGRKATLAVENKLIDQAIYLDEYSSKIKLAMGADIDSELKKVSMKDYISSGKGRIKSSGSDRIAVVYAQGEIIYGKGDEDFIGQDLIINALRKARKSKSTKAIVLRINSPGGSALASELIWRELELTSEQLPVIVSMGNVAASGGYYIACNADKIYAQPTTITGSIGVYGTIPNMSELAGNIGVNAEQVSTNSAPNYSVFEPMTDEFRAVTKEGVEQVYTTFLERVSKGRGMLLEEVDKIAQGRVWSGVEAKEVGLVDELGNLDDAIAYAAELAQLTDYRIRNYPSYKIDLEDRLNKFPFGKAKEQILKEELGEENFQIYMNLKNISNKRGVQARMPFILDIK